MPGEVFHAPFPTGLNGNTVARTLEAIQYLFAADVEPERVAAFIVEPVQGEAGSTSRRPNSGGAARAGRSAWHPADADEVQAGFARTGKLFGIEHSGVEPDLVRGQVAGRRLPLAG
jgi:4-aminobutyrate aminotransferase/(S)-3-amino-2-methylpropionate transaminase